jgi:protein-S-isoprenylcysteine O-methyltransferase Ste14
MTNLNVRALVSVLVLTSVMAVILFVCAGTFDYWQAWIYLAIGFVVSLLITIYLIRKDPELLKRRMRGGPTAEQRNTQRVIMLFTSIAFLALLVVPALDRRFRWSVVSPPIVVIGDGLVLLGFYFIFRVYQENTFTSATIEVAENQKVIATGPYSIVRHPMYAGALIYLFGTPIALGSYWGLLPFVSVIPFLVWRLIDEEQMLTKELSGYDAYRKNVRHRLVPGLW